MQSIRVGALQMAAAMVISGSVGWFVVETGLPAPTVVFWRCLLGGLAMLLACVVLRLPLGDARKRRCLPWILAGGAALTLNWICLFSAYPYASIGVVTVTYHTQPFLLVALGVLAFGERPRPAQWGWLLLAFGGVVMIVVATPSGTTPSANYFTGILLALAAALLYAIAAAIGKRLVDVPTPVVVTVQLLMGSLLLLPFARWPGDAPSHGWALLLTLGFVHTGMMSTLLYSALKKLPTLLVGVLSFLYPVIAIAIDAAAFGHVLGPAQWMGSAAILGAVAGMNLLRAGGMQGGTASDAEHDQKC
ncbi:MULTISPECIES: DMT family transporter [Stenotrophomonas]|jgi:drug/metabolite transporter (DMT)-like permease|nr:MULTISPECIES: DMT family transporter [unclassified Stenotrophomonas]MDG9842228.1 DMT family transporter [Stenotrophomonas sp. GD04054]MDH0018051.1 DMT family transporter [Stenotrophomonas sp. GD04028]MDH0574737.1 DMT family transporter [Stenotrophomonas sp. GD03997]MDH0859846.1 DMT family transporter [Stenotrophomonas sp. GD03882]